MTRPRARLAVYDFGFKATSCARSPTAGASSRCCRRDAGGARPRRSASTASCSRTARATPSRSPTIIEQRARARRRRHADLRHLPRPPAARPRARRPHLQAQVRPPRRQPAGGRPRHAARSRSPARTTASRSTPTRSPPAAAPTEVNLNDGTVEAFAVEGRPILSVQYHPEAAPGPARREPALPPLPRLAPGLARRPRARHETRAGEPACPRARASPQPPSSAARSPGPRAALPARPRSRLLDSTARAALLATALGVAAMGVAMALMTGYREDLAGEARAAATPPVVAYPPGDGGSDAAAEPRRRGARWRRWPESTRGRPGRLRPGRRRARRSARPRSRCARRRARARRPARRRPPSSSRRRPSGACGRGARRATWRGRSARARATRCASWCSRFADGRPRFAYRTLRVAGTFATGFAEFDRGWVVVDRAEVERRDRRRPERICGDRARRSRPRARRSPSGSRDRLGDRAVVYRLAPAQPRALRRARAAAAARSSCCSA